MAKLFTQADEFSMLFQRALERFLRRRIHELGYSPHDAFTCFDADSNGLLSLGELYAAFEFVQMPQLQLTDVLGFARALCQDTAVPAVKYDSFMEAICQASAQGGEEVVELEASAAAGASAAAPLRLTPKRGEELLALLRELVRSERAAEERLVASEAAQHTAARKVAEEKAAVLDFGYIRALQQDRSQKKAANPHHVPSSVFYDFAAVASPLGVSGRVMHDTNGTARTPCTFMQEE